MRKTLFFNVLGVTAALAAPGLSASEAVDEMAILERYGADFAEDPALIEPVTFGVEVGEAFYTVDARPAADGAVAAVTVTAGAPAEPTFYFTIDDASYLARLDKGEVNALTLMAKAFSSDVTPMDIEAQEGFQPGADFGATVIPLTFHFWTRGKPEIISFARQDTRETHGANAGIFYYQEGFRSGWFDIRPGQHVNEDEASRTNPFPSMFLMIEGEVRAVIGEETLTFKAGDAMIVPPDVSHEFFNDGDRRAFGFLFMFGEGA